MKRISLTKNDKINSEDYESCRSCGQETEHSIISDVFLKGENDQGDKWLSTYEIIQCRRCKNISFREHYGESEGEFYPNECGVNEEVYHLIDFYVYPNPIKNYEASEINYIPSKVRRIYTETIDALNSNFTILGGIGIRAILEQICKEKNMPGENLHEKINSLKDYEVITQKDFDILKKLKDLGNSAAHDAEPHSYQTLKTCIEVINHLLKGLYKFTPEKIFYKEK